MPLQEICDLLPDAGEQQLFLVAQPALRPVEQPPLTRVEGWDQPVEQRIFAPNFCYAPIFDGDILGKIVYYREGEPVGESPLAAGGNVPLLPAPEPEGFWARLAK